MIRGIHHVAVHVRDLDRTVKFYGEAFGFEVIGEGFAWREAPPVDRIMNVPGSAGRGCVLKAGNCYLELFEFAAPPPESTRPLRPHDRGYTHLCIDVTDIEDEYARLKAMGVAFHAVPVDMGFVKAIYGQDPDGNVFELQETADDCDFPLDRLR